MFNLAHKGIVRWPLNLVQEVGGQFVDTPVTVSFRVFSREELRTRQSRQLKEALVKLFDIARKAAPKDAEEVTVRETEIHAAAEAMEKAARTEETDLLARITAWSGFGNADTGEELPYMPELGAAVIAHEPHFQALWNGLMEASQQAKPKNSLPGADGATAPGQTTTT